MNIQEIIKEVDATYNGFSGTRYHIFLTTEQWQAIKDYINTSEEIQDRMVKMLHRNKEET